MKRTRVPPGTKVYELNTCQAIRDQAKCPGFNTLRAGRFNLGPIACKCDCVDGAIESPRPLFS